MFDNIIEAKLSTSRIRGFERLRNGVDLDWFPGPWRFVRCRWGPGARRLTAFAEYSANRMMPADTGRIVVDALSYVDEPEEEPYSHDQLVWCDDTPDAKVQTSFWRRELGIRVRPARKAHMRRLSYDWAGLRELEIDPERRPRTFEEFTLKEYMRSRDGSWIDEIPDGNDHSIDAALYAMVDNALRG